MKAYFIKHDWNKDPVVAATLEEAQHWLNAHGYEHKQPIPDLDPSIECWWRDQELARIIPLDLY